VDQTDASEISNAEISKQADELALLMKEFRLVEATLSGKDFKISFKKRSPQRLISVTHDANAQIFEDNEEEHETTPEVVAIPVQKGTPINSPMTGIYYTSASPGSPAFVKEGEAVTAGQVVGLIEAMKVFNEIISPMSGTVHKIQAENGQIVNPGDPLVYIG